MMRLAVILALLAQLIGCAVAIAGQRGEYSAAIEKARLNDENMRKLQIGMPQDKALQIMGAPDKTETEKVDGRLLKVLFYKMQEIGLDLEDKGLSLVPVVFDNGIIIGWGNNFYLHTVKGESDLTQVPVGRPENE